MRACEDTAEKKEKIQGGNKLYSETTADDCPPNRIRSMLRCMEEDTYQPHSDVSDSMRNLHLAPLGDDSLVLR